MKHLRRAARQDSNQKEIVKSLRDIPGVSIELNHNDFLLGYKSRTYWFELKNPDRVMKDGSIRKAALQPDQERLLKEFNGHYKVVHSLEEILEEIGIK
jgi:hypothetical protein